MKKILKRLTKLLPLAMIAVLGFSLVSNVYAQQIDINDPNRPDIQTPRFNAYTNVPYGTGNEADFVRLRESNGDPTVPASTNRYVDPLAANCTPGQKIDISTYIHNSANESHNDNGNGTSVARGVTVDLRAPLGVNSKDFQFRSTIDASNASAVTDTGVLNCANNVKLKLVPQTVKAYSKHLGWTNLANGSVNGGPVSIGSREAGSGIQWGCWDDRIYVVYTVEVVAEPSVKIDKKVDGVENKQVEVGEEFDYQIKVTNDGNVNLDDVAVWDEAPAGVKLVSSDVGQISQTDSGRYRWNYSIPNLAVGESKTYTIKAVVEQYVEGNLVNTACVNDDKVNPEKPDNADDCDDATVTVKKPVYECRDLAALALGEMKYRFTPQIRMRGNVKVTQVAYDFGDGSEQVVRQDAQSVEHSYAAVNQDKTYTVKATVSYSVNGEAKSDNCEAQIKISAEPETPCEYNPDLSEDDEDCVEPCEYDETLPSNDTRCVEPCEYNPSMSADDANCKPAAEEVSVQSLPETGLGGTLTGLSGVVTAAYGASMIAQARRKK